MLLKACELSERVKSQSPESNILRSRRKRREPEPVRREGTRVQRRGAEAPTEPERETEPEESGRAAARGEESLALASSFHACPGPAPYLPWGRPWSRLPGRGTWTLSCLPSSPAAGHGEGSRGQTALPVETVQPRQDPGPWALTHRPLPTGREQSLHWDLRGSEARLHHIPSSTQASSGHVLAAAPSSQPWLGL